MKKIITILLTFTLIVCMTIPAFAVTPTLNPPKLPTIPEIKVEVEIPDSVFDNWFKKHPIVIDWSKIKLG